MASTGVGVGESEGCTHCTPPPPSHHRFRHHPQAISFEMEAENEGTERGRYAHSLWVKNREMTENRAISGMLKEAESGEALETRSLCLGFCLLCLPSCQSASQDLSE